MAAVSGTIHCTDHYGRPHDIPAEKFRFRASAYGILTREQDFLMVRDPWANLWEFPGGGINIDETLAEGLIREFKEESGLEVRVGPFVTMLEDFFYSGDIDQAWHSLRFIYRVQLTGGTLAPGGNGIDVAAAAWLPRSELHERNTKPAIWSVLQTV